MAAPVVVPERHGPGCQAGIRGDVLRHVAAGSLRPVGKSDAVASQGVRGPRPPFKELSSVKPLSPCEPLTWTVLSGPGMPLAVQGRIRGSAARPGASAGASVRLL